MDLWHCRLRGMKICSPSYPSGVVDGVPTSVYLQHRFEFPVDDDVQRPLKRCYEIHLDSLVASFYQVEVRSVTRNGGQIEQGVPVAEVTPRQVVAFVLESLSHRP